MLFILIIIIIIIMPKISFKKGNLWGGFFGFRLVEPLLWDWLVRKGLDKLVDVF